MSEEQQLVSDAPVTDAPAVADTPAETTSTPAAETTEVDSGDVADPEQIEADKALKRGKNWYGRKIDALTREREQVRADNQRLMSLLERGLPQPQTAAQPAADQPPQRSQYGDIEDFFKAQARYEARQEATAAVKQRSVPATATALPRQARPASSSAI